MHAYKQNVAAVEQRYGSIGPGHILADQLGRAHVDSP
jgi:hypothetical protein